MESDKITTKRHIQESQDVSTFPAGAHKAARHRQDKMTKANKKDPQKKYRLGTVSKKITGWLKIVPRYNHHP